MIPKKNIKSREQALRAPRLKVALVTYALNPSGNERSLVRLGKWLEVKGYCVEIVTTGKRASQEDSSRLDGIPLHNLAAFDSRRSPWHARRVGVALKKLAYDVVFLSDARSAQVAIGCLSDNVLVCPIVRCDRTRDYRMVAVGASIWNVAVGISPRVCQKIVESAPGRPVKLIPNGVELPQRFHRSQSRRCISEECRIAFVGRLSPEKGLEILKEVVDHCVESGLSVVLKIAGDGPGGTELRQSLAQHVASGVVVFLGWQETHQVYDILAESHVLLFPSEREGLGNVVLEAQACGCVPVARRIEGVTTYTIDDGQSGLLIDSGRPVDYAEAIEELCSKPKKWDRLSSNATIKARGFSVDAMGEAYEGLILDWLKGEYKSEKSRRWVPSVDLAGFLTAFSWRELVPSPLRRLFRVGMPESDL